MPSLTIKPEPLCRPVASASESDTIAKKKGKQAICDETKAISDSESRGGSGERPAPKPSKKRKQVIDPPPAYVKESDGGGDDNVL